MFECARRFRKGIGSGKSVSLDNGRIYFSEDIFMWLRSCTETSNSKNPHTTPIPESTLSALWQLKNVVCHYAALYRLLT